MNEGWVVGVAMLLVVAGLFVAYQRKARARLRRLQEARNVVIEVAREVGATAEAIRRRRCLEEIEAGSARWLLGEPLPELAAIAELWSLRACRSAVGNRTSMPGQLSTLVPQLVLAADSILNDLRRMSDEHAGQARPELLGELLIMSCAYLEVSDRLVAEVGLLYPDVAIPSGTPGDTELIYRKNLAGSAIASLIKAREVEAAIDLDLRGAGRAGGASGR